MTMVPPFWEMPVLGPALPCTISVPPRIAAPDAEHLDLVHGLGGAGKPAQQVDARLFRDVPYDHAQQLAGQLEALHWRDFPYTLYDLAVPDTRVGRRETLQVGHHDERARLPHARNGHSRGIGTTTPKGGRHREQMLPNRAFFTAVLEENPRDPTHDQRSSEVSSQVSTTWRDGSDFVRIIS